LGGGGTGVCTRVDVRATRGGEKEWNRGGQDNSPDRGNIEGALGMSDKHCHHVVGVCGNVVREIDFCIRYSVLAGTTFGLGPICVLLSESMWCNVEQ